MHLNSISTQFTRPAFIFAFLISIAIQSILFRHFFGLSSFQDLYDCHESVNTKKNLHKFYDEKDSLPSITPHASVKCVTKSDKAWSAFERTKSQECKEKIEQTTCLLLEDQLFANHLDSQCPGQNELFASHVGCFKDNREPFLYANHSFLLPTTEAGNSPVDWCGHTCLRYGFSLFGLEEGGRLCFCLHQIPWQNAIDSKFCNLKCPVTVNAKNKSSKDNKCGGYFAANIYQTGLNRIYFQPEMRSYGQINRIKIAFILLFSGRNFDQTWRLFRAIYRRHHLYYIHVDSESEYLHSKLKQSLSKWENILFSKHRFDTIWGGTQLLDAVIHSVTNLLAVDTSWQYVINLSESDFPIQTVESLEAHLFINRGKNFLKHHGYTENRRFLTRQGFEKTFVQCDRHMWLLGDRRLPAGLVYSGGSDWFALDRNFCTFMTNTTNPLVTTLSHLFSYTLLPVESFLHTLLQNSPFCRSMVNNNLRFTNWQRSSGCKCQHRAVVDWCGCSPNVFKSESDFNRIRLAVQRKKFFARKFVSTLDTKIISSIEKQLLDIEIQKPGWKALQDSVWLNLFHFAIDTQKGLTMELLASLSSFTLLTMLAFNLTGVPESVGDQVKTFSVREVFYHHSTKVLQPSLVIAFYDPIRRSDFEIFVVPFKQKIVFPKIGFNERRFQLAHWQVCSQFDAKERVFLKYGCLLTPYDIPSVFHEWTKDSSMQSSVDPFVITFVWYDPTGTQMDTFQIDLNTNSTDPNRLSELSFVHALQTSTSPLKPGEWRLSIFDGHELLHENRFLVTPLLIGLLPPNHSNEFPELLVCVEEAKELCDRQLLHWQSLMTSFWSLDAICSTRFDRQANLCSHQHWSRSSISDLTLSDNNLRD